MVKLLIPLLCLFSASLCAQTGTTRSRQQAIREHEERIHRITEEAKARREGRPYIPTSAPLTSRAATTSTREERIKAHQDRMQSIIEASRQRRGESLTSTTRANDQSNTEILHRRIDAYKRSQEGKTSATEAIDLTTTTGRSRGTTNLQDPEMRRRIQEHQDRIQNIIDESRLRKLEQATTSPQ